MGCKISLRSGHFDIRLIKLQKTKFQLQEYNNYALWSTNYFKIEIIPWDILGQDSD